MARFVMLNRPLLNEYHMRRFNTHGGLYLVQREKNGILEAKSIATGVVVSLDDDMVLEFDNAVCE